MKTLLVLRHAKSSWNNAGMSDHERPLNKRGKADAPRMGKLIKREELTPDLIISSTANRALMTAERVALAADYEEVIETNRNFYLAPPEVYIHFLNSVPNDKERVMVVGHNGGVEDLINVLTGTWEQMPTAALAQISLPINDWSELSEETKGKLINHWIPKHLPMDNG